MGWAADIEVIGFVPRECALGARLGLRFRFESDHIERLPWCDAGSGLDPGRQSRIESSNSAARLEVDECESVEHLTT